MHIINWSGSWQDVHGVRRVQDKYGRWIIAFIDASVQGKNSSRSGSRAEECLERVTGTFPFKIELFNRAKGIEGSWINQSGSWRGPWSQINISKLAVAALVFSWEIFWQYHSGIYADERRSLISIFAPRSVEKLLRSSHFDEPTQVRETCTDAVSRQKKNENLENEGEKYVGGFQLSWSKKLIGIE